MSEQDRSAWPLGRIAGLVTLGGVMAWAFALAVLGTDRRAYGDIVRWSGNVVGRLMLSLVVFAAALHLVDGIARCLGTGRPDRWRAAAWFVALALGVPATAVLVWPFVEGRVS
jgi:hypothetical protein